MIGLIEEVVIARGTNANDKIRLNAIFYTYINLPTFFFVPSGTASLDKRERQNKARFGCGTQEVAAGQTQGGKADLLSWLATTTRL